MKYTYEDPTGGGDDITLDIPAWLTPPGVLRLLDTNREEYYFPCVGETDEED